MQYNVFPLLDVWTESISHKDMHMHIKHTWNCSLHRSRFFGGGHNINVSCLSDDYIKIIQQLTTIYSRLQNGDSNIEKYNNAITEVTDYRKRKWIIGNRLTDTEQANNYKASIWMRLR